MRTERPAQSRGTGREGQTASALQAPRSLALMTVSQEPRSPAELCPLLARMSGAENTGQVLTVPPTILEEAGPARARFWGVVSRLPGARPVTATALPAENKRHIRP